MTRPFFGYHMPLFTFPGVADDQLFEHIVGLVQAAEKAGFDMVTVMDHFYQIRGVGPEEAPMLEAYTLLERPRRADQPRAPWHDGVGRDLPQPCPAGQDGDDPRHHLGRTGDPGPGRGVERGRAQGLRLRLPAHARADGPPGGGPGDLPPHVHPGAAELPGHATTDSIARSTTLDPSSRAAPRSSSAAAAKSAPCAWSPASATSPTGGARWTS